MQSSKILAGVGILVLVVAIGLGVGWFATRDSAPKVATEGLVQSDLNVSVAQIKVTAPPQPAPPVAIASNPVPVRPRIVRPVTPPPIVTTNVNAAWEDKLDEILASDDEDTNKVKQLFSMFPALPPDGQEEVAQHLSNLVEDEDYAPLGKLLADPKLPDAVLDVLMADLLNRPNADKLPLLMQIVQTPNHPQKDEAKDLLELYLDEDYSGNPVLLKQKITDWLKENPD